MTRRKPKVAYRKVEPLNPSIWQDAYQWLIDNNKEDFLNGVETAVDQGYTPDEIYRHILREAGLHRIELAKRCQNAARHIISQQED
jgi:hypothetical protein